MDVYARCAVVARIYPSRTWMSGSSQSMWGHARVHRLDLGLYSHTKEETESEPMLTPWKIPSTRGSEEGLVYNLTLHRTASPTHHRLSSSGPAISPSHSKLNTGPTSPSTVPMTPTMWQGNYQSTKFSVTGMTQLGCQLRPPTPGRCLHPIAVVFFDKEREREGRGGGGRERERERQTECVCVCVCVCVYACMREREREIDWVSERKRVCVCMCVCAHTHAPVYVWTCVLVCVCV